ncbi:hypothetical protein [Nocardia terpenica]|uniref:Uncharacterized protein n=1 Tax=Nocardia terpenica TaxID=455432 RepID=A0A164K2P3_9NOCA|nr:hypothetical protein [Nocardia terpenica]KZM70966.1 hypothetical protein AWN90_41310 [Nocardia terpenica]NQE89724.1 hypothetical protein [Nocardia terpenica]
MSDPDEIRGAAQHPMLDIGQPDPGHHLERTVARANHRPDLDHAAADNDPPGWRADRNTVRCTRFPVHRARPRASAIQPGTDPYHQRSRRSGSRRHPPIRSMVINVSATHQHRRLDSR